ncbi:MAG: GNAT family N-acetyltransferase [Chryseobacterium sp.]|nr:MAG: GNAT family N-acetyltransferase [Chryseobacterium sp.]
MRTPTEILSEIEVIGYEEQYKEAFKQLNLVWLNKYFTMEEGDIEILNHPERIVLESGGHILFLKHHDRIIGTAALKYLDTETFELNKMTVDESYRGVGAGKLLCSSAIEKAKLSGAKTLILYSVRSLEAAIATYKKLGFQEIPLEAGNYKRANIKMSLKLNDC